MRKTKARRKRKHTIGYYLTCGAPLTPIAHLEQLFAEGEPVWTAEFGAARSARKPGPDEQAEITARSDARASARAPRSSRRTGSACRPRVASRVKWPPTSLDAASAHRASPSARLAVPATDHGYWSGRQNGKLESMAHPNKTRPVRVAPEPTPTLSEEEMLGQNLAAAYIAMRQGIGMDWAKKTYTTHGPVDKYWISVARMVIEHLAQHQQRATDSSA